MEMLITKKVLLRVSLDMRILLEGEEYGRRHPEDPMRLLAIMNP